MKKQMVLIIDTDKMTKEEWNAFFKKYVEYAAWLHPDDYELVTDFVDQTQNNRAIDEYKKASKTKI